MDETKKTGIFWAVGLVMLMIGLFVSWPTKTVDNEGKTNQLLFDKFTDPLAASQMKVVTFNEERGELDEFIVRKNTDTDLWTIESKADYPADAVEQVKKTANALIGLKILDTQTTNAEDHAELGVVEPDLQKLQVGDEGVGRLVTFKDKGRETLAAVIVGDPLKDDPTKRYVRIPGQDPVYVVNFDPTSVTTEFQDWIEEDLLQLSSIDIGKVTIDDYSASISSAGKFAMDRNYVATVRQEGTDWNLERLAEYDASSIEPTEVEVAEDKKLDTAKFNDMKNALDDLKFVNVYRKPPGMSASLRANEDLLKDNESLSSLLGRGFYPVAMQADGQDREVEIVAANGELRVSTNGGVEYTLRFGNVNTAEQKGAAGEDAEGVNRYLLVTTSVDESQFPVPELAKVPESVEQLKEMMQPKQEDPETEAETSAETPTEIDEESSDAPAMKEDSSNEGSSENGDSEKDAEEPSEEMKSETPAEEKPAEEKPADEKTADEKPADESSSNEASPEKTSDKSAEKPADTEPAASDEKATEGEATDSGSGEAEGSGSGQEADEDATTEEEASTAEPKADAPKTPEAEDTAEPASESETATADEPNVGEDMSKLTDEEWQELLEAEQEKITKSNQRLMDQRKDNMSAAERKVNELNARFADWYYVIPESTYNKLRIKQSELFEGDEADANAAAPSPDAAMPSFNIPGLGN